jgi:hypothetical protein
MTKLSRLLLVTLAVVLSGCAATVTKPASSQAQVLASSVSPTKVAVVITGSPAIQASADWNTFCAEWRTAFTSAASSAGLSFAYFESEPADQPVGTTLVKIAVNDYRYLTPGARFGFGIMTGNAFIDADAEFLELPAKRKLGSQKFSTSSTAWQGVFSAMTDKQVQALSMEMVQEVKKR